MNNELSGTLQAIHDSGDVGCGVEGLAEQAAVLEDKVTSLETQLAAITVALADLVDSHAKTKVDTLFAELSISIAKRTLANAQRRG